MAYSGRYRVEGDDTLIINIDVAWHKKSPMTFIVATTPVLVLWPCTRAVRMIRRRATLTFTVA